MPKSTFIEDPMVMQPLGLFYLAARLESLGHRTEFFDLNEDNMPKDVFDQIWVSATSPQMQEIKSIGRLPYKAKKVLGGASVWANPDSCKGLGYDLIVGGESDSPESIERILNHNPLADGEHLVLPISKTLEWVLPPVRRWSRRYKSFLTDLDGNKRKCTTMFTSRGCPLECFTGDMKLLVKDGYKRFDELVGDVEFYYSKGRVWKVGKRKTVKLTIATRFGGESRTTIIRCTPEHRLIGINGEEIEAQNSLFKVLKPHSNVHDPFITGFFPCVVNVEIRGEEDVYDFQVYDDTHLGVVEGVWVHNCAFCESGRHGVIWDRLTRYESLEVVEEQIKQCYNMGYRALAYYDDILPLNKKRTQKIMELHQKYEMIWRCFMRSDIINNQGGYDYLKDMRDGGLVEVFVGVESASNEIKNNITKKTTIEQDTNIVEWCRELGIRCKTSFILGLPGESRETMEETRRWILKNRPDRVQCGRIIPFPGTPLFKNPQNYDMKVEYNVDDDWFYMGHNETAHSFVSTSHLTVKEIDDFWHKLNQEMKDLGIPS